jgi:hypothetical protein
MIRATPRHSGELLRIVGQRRHSAMRGAEVGVYRGGTSRVLLQHLPELYLYMIDNWETPSTESPYTLSGDPTALLSPSEQTANRVEAETVTEFAQGRRRVMQCDSAGAAQHLPDNFFDFAFIDADHTYEAVRADIHAWWPKVRQGGIFCGHDYGFRLDRRGRWGVSKAVNEFAQSISVTVQVARHYIWWFEKPMTPRTPARSSPEAGTIVRVLYGDLDTNLRLKQSVTTALRDEWSRSDVVHVVAGEKNAEFLRAHGAQHVTVACDDPSGDPKKYGKWYPKPYLIRRAMEEHPEILYLDFDCRVCRPKDAQMWTWLRTKGGPFNGTLQAANMGYRGRVCLGVFRDPKVHPVRQCLQCAAIYCSDRTWIDDWLASYDDLVERGLGSAIINDETVLMHVLDKFYGVLSAAEMVENFEMPILRVKRSLPEAVATKVDERVYFWHR